MKVVTPQKISIKDNPELDEKWVQELIAEDPSILGLGELILKDKERKQPKAGRLDLLLQDPDSNRRYEVEVQLGKTDESHIIRTIEYWDVERKRFPQYDHCAVIVAEDITARFLNVISLFNGNIPLIAVQMNALRIGDQIALFFTTVLDELVLGSEEEEEVLEVTDRNYWETKRGSKETVALADECLSLIHTFAPELVLKYNKFYIGLAKNTHAMNFVKFRAKKKNLRLEIRHDISEEVQKLLDETELDVMDYDKHWGYYRIRLTKKDIETNQNVLVKVMKMAFERFGG